MRKIGVNSLKNAYSSLRQKLDDILYRQEKVKIFKFKFNLRSYTTVIQEHTLQTASLIDVPSLRRYFDIPMICM